MNTLPRNCRLLRVRERSRLFNPDPDFYSLRAAYDDQKHYDSLPQPLVTEIIPLVLAPVPRDPLIVAFGSSSLEPPVLRPMQSTPPMTPLDCDLATLFSVSTHEEEESNSLSWSAADSLGLVPVTSHDDNAKTEDYEFRECFPALDVSFY